MDAKRIAAEKAVEHVQAGMVVGLGTGSTATWAIKALGEKVKAGLRIRAVASSEASERLARQYTIPIVDFSGLTCLDLTIDGADEVDARLNLIKGGGGALLREKILAYNSRAFVVVVDQSKLVGTLGHYPLPVELVPFAVELTLHQLRQLGCTARIRQAGGHAYITDNGNLIADCHFGKIEDPDDLNARIQLLPGVVESGLFLHAKVSQVIVGYPDGTTRHLTGTTARI